MSSIAKNFEVYSKALDLRSQRHQVLASNIANADTPNYKARDFDFSAAMQNALGGKVPGGALPMRLSAPGHLDGSGGGAVLQPCSTVRSSSRQLMAIRWIWMLSAPRLQTTLCSIRSSRN